MLWVRVRIRPNFHFEKKNLLGQQRQLLDQIHLTPIYSNLFEFYRQCSMILNERATHKTYGGKIQKEEL